MSDILLQVRPPERPQSSSPSTIPAATAWPRHPYRGLDFYRQTEARLFRGRDKDIAECAEMLLGFGVKILVLQGSSGSGKSSFLRAGLIPHLRQKTRGNFLLNGGDGVVRCTADPLPQIAGALIAALCQRTECSETIVQSCANEAAEVDENLCGALVQKLKRAIAGSRLQAAELVADALVDLCGELPGKLILIMDQAEEVLTRSPADVGGADTTGAFFRFLEEVYLRNVDVRLVVTLRTEYYGRFRDELRISDDRLAKRPRSGGIDSYLLRPLRDSHALVNIVTAPVLARDEDGAPIYNFSFEPGLPERIVDDLLGEFPHQAITPALQLVCASLHGRLTQNNRMIARADYTGLKGITGIFRSYVAGGIGAAGPHAEADAEKWHQLLYSLVSRQGGGTVVSLSEPVEELERRAHNLGIGGNIADAFLDLTRGAAPLLRGEPPEAPRYLSLKHDVLAVFLSRWFHEHSARLKAKKEEAAKRRLMLAFAVPTVLAFVLGAVLFGYQRGQEALTAQTKAVQITSRHAIRAPEGDFRRSLLLTLANIDSTRRPSNFYEWISGGNRMVREEALQALREVLPRAPWFAGRFAAVGLDPIKNRVAMLQRDQSALLTFAFPEVDGERAAPAVESHSLPERPARRSLLRPAAGFVSGLGPAAIANGYLYFLNEREAVEECDLEAKLPQSIAASSWIRVEFLSGRLQLSATERHGSTTSLRVLRLDAADLRACSDAIAATALISIPIRASAQPAPVFTDAVGGAQAFEYLEETAERPATPAAANLPVDPVQIDASKLVELDALVSPVDRPGMAMRIPVGQIAPERGLPERLHYTIGFAANAPAIVFKFDGPDFYIYNLAGDHPGNRGHRANIAPQHIAVRNEATPQDWRLQTGRLPWLYPPLAAAKKGQHWRAAWLAPSGIWVVEASDRDPGTAVPLLNAPLIGEPDGMKLQLTADGEFLVLTASQGLRSPVAVRVWNLRASWHDWIADPATSEAELREVACRIVRADGRGGAVDDAELDLFQIDPRYREPCPE